MQNQSEVALFSVSTIGSPFAFSTAIKRASLKKDPPDRSPRGSNRFSLGSNSDADSPRVLGLPSLEEREENNDVKKTPMLSPTHNDSTVGILDLDSIQFDSSTNRPFLTSPQAATGLHEAVIVLGKPPDPAISDTASLLGVDCAMDGKSLAPSISDTASNCTMDGKPLAPSISDTASDCTVDGKSLSPSISDTASDCTMDGKPLAPSINIDNSREGLPSMLLQNKSALSVSHISGSDSEGDTVLSAMASALALYRNSSSSGGCVVSSPISLESSLEGVTSVMKVSPQPSGANINQDCATCNEEKDVLGTGDLTVAPSVGHSHVPIIPSSAVVHALPADTMTVGVATACSSVGGVGDIPARYSFTDLGDTPGDYLSGSGNSMEGLPSTYLHLQDSTYPYDPTDFTSSLSMFHSHLEPMGPTSDRSSGSTLMSSSLANNMSDFSDELGVGRARQGDGETEDIHNPFDEDNSCAGAFEQADFEEMDSGCFAAQLEKDEEELNRFHQSYASSTQGVSFDLRSPYVSGGHFADSMGDASISTYFQKKSHSLGQPFSGKLPPEDRPQFSDSSGHVIVSPENLNKTIITSREEGETTPMQNKVTPLLDMTLVIGNEDIRERDSEGTAISQIKYDTYAEHVQSNKDNKTSVEHSQFTVSDHEYIHQVPALCKNDIPKFILRDTFSFLSTTDASLCATPTISSFLTSVTTSIITDLSPSGTVCGPLLSDFSPTSSSAVLLLHDDKLSSSLNSCKMSSTRWDPLPSTLAKPSFTSGITTSSTEKSLQAHSFPPLLSCTSSLSDPATGRHPGPGYPRTLHSSSAKPTGATPDVAHSRLIAPTVSRQEQLKPPFPSSAAPVDGLQKENSGEEMRIEMMQKLLKLQEDIELARASANLAMANTKLPWRCAAPPSPPQSTSNLFRKSNEALVTNFTMVSPAVVSEKNDRVSTSFTSPFSTSSLVFHHQASPSRNPSVHGHVPLTSLTPLDHTSRTSLDPSSSGSCDSSPSVPSLPVPSDSLEASSSESIYKVIFSPSKLRATQSIVEQTSLVGSNPLESSSFNFTPTSFLPSSLPPLLPTSPRTSFTSPHTSFTSPLTSFTSSHTSFTSSHTSFTSPHTSFTSSPPCIISTLSPSPRTSSSLPYDGIGVSTSTMIGFSAAPSGPLPGSLASPLHSPLQTAMESLMIDRLASLVKVRRGDLCLASGSDAGISTDAVNGAFGVGGACEIGDNVRDGEAGVRVQTMLRTRTSLAPTIIAEAQEPMTQGALDDMCSESNVPCDNHVITNSQHSLVLDHMTSDCSHSAPFCRHVQNTSVLQAPLTPSHMTTGTTSISSSTSHMTASPIQSYSSTCLVGTSLAHLMYTSPPLHPNLTTSPPLLDCTLNTFSTPNLDVTGMHQFSDVCCTNISTADYIEVANPGERWLQVSFDVTGTSMDGVQFYEGAAVFVFPERSYVKPKHTTLVKVTFSPTLSGSYESEVRIYASFMVSTRHGPSMPPTASITLRAVAEQPQLELYPKQPHNSRNSASCNVLDYGVMVGGSIMRGSFELINKGRAELPLEVTIDNSLDSAKHFSFHSLPPSLLSSSPFPPHQHNTLSFILPAMASDSAMPSTHTLEISFTAPQQHSISAVTSNLSPPQVVSARLEVRLEGSNSKPGPLQAMALIATVGQARLCVPKSLEAISLSCTVGHAVTRTVPLCNIGNIPVAVHLGMEGTNHTHFTVNPDSLLLEPNEEYQVTVRFDSPTVPLIVEGLMQVHIEPGGPCFEVKLRGTAVSLSPRAEGILSCNRRYLYWGGVALGGAKQFDLLLHNSFPTTIPLRLSVRHPLAPFRLDHNEVTLLPQEEVTVKINFFPLSTSIFVTALDVFDRLHARKFLIPLCGYGGISRLEVGGVRFTPNSGHRLDISKVRHSHGKTVKILLYNSGPRAAFMHAECQGLESHTPLPDNRAHVTPPNLVIPENSTGELQLFYCLNKLEEDECSVVQSSLARLVIQSGDECIRKKLVHAVREEKESSVLATVNGMFMKDFANQEKEITEMEWNAFHLDNIESVFSSHLTLTSITLIVSPESTHHKSSMKISPDSPQNLETTRQSRLPLCPSYTPLEKEVKVRSQLAAPDSLCTIREDSALSLSLSEVHHDVYEMTHNDSEKNQHVAKWLSQTKLDMAHRQSGQNRACKKVPSQKKMVYLSTGFIQFSNTEVGSCSTFKVRVCNRDNVGHRLEVIKPANPFAISHQTFTLGSRMCARLPVHFTPKYAGEFEGILALHTRAGHQAFAQLKGRAILSNHT